MSDATPKTSGDLGPGTPGDLRTFGRRRGRRPSARQEQLLRELLPRVAIDLTQPPGELLRAWSEPEAGEERSVWLEIGFGGAEHLIWQAEQNPGTLLIGCEPFEDGVIKALSAIEQKGLRNVRIHADDARPLLRWLPLSSVERAFVLFPDPWPKKKHVKRRLVSAPLLSLLASVLRPGGELRIATDIGDYARTTLLAIGQEPRLRWLATSPRDWRERPGDWPQTRYEAKAVREGRRRYFFRFLRV